MRSVRATLSILLGAALACPPAAGQVPPQDARPLDIGDRRQVFIDGSLLTDAKAVELVVHPPRKTGERTIDTDRPWEKGGIGPYSSVLMCGGTYHMWYHAMDSVQWDTDRESGAICYARSKDGIHWEKPNLGIAAYGGDKDNNIVIGHGAAGLRIGQDGGMVFRDPNAPEGEQFRMLARFDAEKTDGGTLDLWSSPDGIRWRVTHRSILTSGLGDKKGHHLDSQNVLFWDDAARKYVAYVRKNMHEPSTQGRSIARAESDHLGGFPPVEELPVVLGPDAQDIRHGDRPLVDYYMSAAFKYPWADRAYYMFPTAYYHYVGGALAEFPKEVPTNAGPLDTQFAASRDGIRWRRFDRRPFVPLGMKGEFDWASARTIWGLVLDVDGREMYLYYRASDWLHGWDRDPRNKRLLSEAGLSADRNIAVLSRLVLRRDGFISVRSAYAGGAFTTPPLIFRGGRLALNVDTSATGVVQVGLLGEDGKEIEGFKAGQCDRIHTCNEINRTVTWGRRSDVGGLAGRPVRLRFVLQNADLYAFQFGG